MNHLQLQVSIGALEVAWCDAGRLASIRWQGRESDNGAPESWRTVSRIRIPDVVDGLVGGLRSYFASGEPLSGVPWENLDQAGWTDFQRRVYRAICEIPHGETRTYAWVARKVGNVMATRAVGQTLRKNPLPILIPCHRVVASQSLGGFMGESDPSFPELQLKKRLIDLERSYVEPPFPFLQGVAG